MSHYFSEKQETPLNLRKVKALLRKHEFDFFSGSGVFSKDHIDKGSVLLVNSVSIRDGWNVLDLGCGIGVVGVVVKKLFPTTKILCTDVNKRAITLTQMNFTLHKLEAEVRLSNSFEKIPERFDTIIVNPPQKAGKDVCFSMIEQSKEHLSEGGLLQLVARHQKGGKELEKKMKEVFGNVETLAKGGGYRVYCSANRML
ncbi:MAG TPA: methyltransferase [Candidatus Nanoarchaeia archaeon]|nr:methyltransferase [Candidatus Nanoarchaeia archaeon]